MYLLETPNFPDLAFIELGSNALVPQISGNQSYQCKQAKFPMIHSQRLAQRQHIRVMWWCLPSLKMTGCTVNMLNGLSKLRALEQIASRFRAFWRLSTLFISLGMYLQVQRHLMITWSSGSQTIVKFIRYYWVACPSGRLRWNSLGYRVSTQTDISSTKQTKCKNHNGINLGVL